jgi:hypothetical protein
VERLEGTVKWIDLDTVLANGALDPEDVDEDALRDRPPKDAHCYAVWALDLKRGRTLSRFDYRLRHAGGVSPCLALRRGVRPYDPRVLELRGPDRASLLFEVPAGTDRITLEFALAATVPQPKVENLPFGETASSPEPPSPAEQAPPEPTEAPKPAPAQGTADSPPAKPEENPRPSKPAQEPEKTKPKPPAKPGDDLGDLF